MKLPKPDRNISPPAPRYRPCSFQPYEGLAAFLPLDYGSRYEHCVILIPRHWCSLYELIKNPWPMVERARASYRSTPAATGSTTPIPWDFHGLMTINIAPLTEMNSKTMGALRHLNQFYQFDTAIAEHKTVPPPKFSTYVQAGASQPRPNPVPGGLTWDRFPLQYVAIFALETRILTILYMPRTNDPSSGNYRAHWHNEPEYYQNLITQVTNGQILNTDIWHLHFDVDYGSKQRTYEDVAASRAALAVDYICDPAAFLNTLASTRMNLNANKAMPPNITNQALYAQGGFAYSSKNTDLLQQPLSSGNYPTFLNSQPAPDGSPSYVIPPHVIVDSVWPDYSKPGHKIAGFMKHSSDTPSIQSDDPAPLTCVQITLQQYTIGGAPQYSGGHPIYITGDGVIKYYNDLIGAGDG